MKNFKAYWIFGLLGILLVVAVPVMIFAGDASASTADNPWEGVPQRPIHVPHADIVTSPFETPQDVTRACLECHPNAASDVMKTSHWTWESKEFNVPWRDEPVTIGKINQINNFCISAQTNQKSCMSCHIGHGWQETDDFSQAFDFDNPENVDCLVCHAQSGYAKGNYGNPAEFVDLLTAAKSVGYPTRKNCGSCHFNGGGGNNVKHGDLSEQLYFPSPEMDVHMGQNGFECIDCHTTENHQVKGRLLSDNYTIKRAEQVACTDCHIETPHEDQRLNSHTTSIACQTCHIPTMATKDPTKTTWDWSTSGLEQEEDHFTYLKIKGDFEYESNLLPVYLWYNGNNDYRYLLGDPINPDGPTMINLPSGEIKDPHAKIYPFKVHKAIQPYDTGYNYLLAPITSGPDGYWTTFDWDDAFRVSEQRMGACPTAENTALPKPGCTGPPPTSSNPPNTPCNAPTATAKAGVSTRKPSATPATQ